ncbi:type II toxin-antitoxin system VapC family toxin [Methylophilus sp. VKM B-3414]|uniref:type II toxin-antitoxin system VapC family toxin n=1 Tax=Methylophilus sp. VKM B-3414 TaxID=3076121 RepID=UPI0028C5CF95|nr:type II toxin-antitoxin system VapC family toxin [Methylophilus sp. VKM B-3414]MDT7848118.1 type II toxin-antitoxin system VapC family toxin [Methylophilus sp. VKM B-3414]
MTTYLLDTNTVSYFLKRHPSVTRRITSTPMSSVCISAITEGELRFGLAKRPEATQLKLLVDNFLRHIVSRAWDTEVTTTYGRIRAELTLKGVVLSPLDLLIAAHALHLDAILVTNDQAFSQVTGLKVENWTIN